jgi:hypothetical protein
MPSTGAAAAMPPAALAARTVTLRRWTAEGRRRAASVGAAVRHGAAAEAAGGVRRGGVRRGVTITGATASVALMLACIPCVEGPGYVTPHAPAAAVQCCGFSKRARRELQRQRQRRGRAEKSC